MLGVTSSLAQARFGCSHCHLRWFVPGARGLSKSLRPWETCQSAQIAWHSVGCTLFARSRLMKVRVSTR